MSGSKEEMTKDKMDAGEYYVMRRSIIYTFHRK
jgi:hypothetical protein